MTQYNTPSDSAAGYAGDQAAGTAVRADEVNPSACVDGHPAQTKIPLHEQAACAQRELAMRHRVYPGLVKRGRMTEAEAAREIDLMRAVRDTLRLFAEHEDALRQTLRREMAAARDADTVAAGRLDEATPGATLEVEDIDVPFELANHPAVTAVREVFPGATVAAVRPISRGGAP